MTRGLSAGLASLLVPLLAVLTACGNEAEEEAGAGQEAPAAETAETAESPEATGAAADIERPTRLVNQAMRDRIRAELPAALDQLVAELAWRQMMPRALSQANPFNVPEYRREVLEPLYQERDFRPAFLDPSGGLTPRAEVLLNELRAAHHHALDPSAYRLGDLDRLEPAVTTAAPLGWEWSLDDDGVRAVEASLHALLEPSIPALAQLAAGLEGEAPIPEVAEQFEARLAEAREALRDDLELELVVAHAFLSYAFDMKHFNTNRVTPNELARAGGQREVQRARLRQSFRDAADATPEELVAQLEALYPAHTQYVPLMTSLARYREILASGGWEHVSPRSLRAGRSHSRVADLKRRLAIEGFYDEPIDNRYDDALVEAVRSYQVTHQMDASGETHNMFWSSLNVPAERRLAQIELTLQRWRETRMRGEDYYVYINVPDFEAEVWRDGERQTRFRIVVGNTDRECNPTTGRYEYVNATPVQHAEMEYLVFNPYWNVPSRIRRDEIDIELLENPTWLQENGYEVVVGPSGPRIRQLPGEDNALGAVKFIFPNIHNTYMHDTPHQRYFDFPIRNYSHGCMRVQNPMDFAELLLTNDGRWDPARIARIQESGIETTVHLEEHVPVFIEYYVVTVDDEGRTNFLSDIYRYDRQRLDDWEHEECEVPEPAVVAGFEIPHDEPVVQWNDDGTAVTPDGTIIHPDGRVELSEARALGLEATGDAALEGDDGVRRALQRRTLERDPDSQPDPGDIGP